LTLPATLLSRLQGAAPNTAAALLTLINNAALPPPSDAPTSAPTVTGADAAPDVPARPLFEAATGLGEAAAARLNE